MIKINTIRGFSDVTDEGKLLLASLAALTSLSTDDIKSGKFGGKSNPDDVIKRITDLANRIYYKEEWEAEELINKRDFKINNILK